MYICSLPFLPHAFSPWEKVQEIAIWKYPGELKVREALGFQPLYNQTYLSPDRRSTFLKPEVDQDYKLVGKLIEQRRICSRCNYTQINIQKYKV